MGVGNQPLWAPLTPRNQDFIYIFFSNPQEELRWQKAHHFNSYFILGVDSFSFHISDKYWL